MWPGVGLALRDHLNQTAERAEAMATGANQVPWSMVATVFASEMKIARAIRIPTEE